MASSKNDILMDVTEGLNGVENPFSGQDCEENSSMLKSHDQYIHSQDRTRMTADLEPAHNHLSPLPSAKLFANDLIKQLAINNGHCPNQQLQTQSTLQAFKYFHDQAFLKDMKAKQKVVLDKLELRKAKEAEVQALKENIEKLLKQKQECSDQLASSKCEQRKKQAKLALTTAERIFRTSENKLKDKVSARDKAKAKYDDAKNTLESIMEEDRQLSKWISDHSVKLNFSAPDNAPSNEVLIVLRNIDSGNPDKEFYIILDSIVPETGNFVVKSLFPDFKDAHSVIQSAEKQQDMLQLLRDCRKNWQLSLRAEEMETV